MDEIKKTTGDTGDLAKQFVKSIQSVSNKQIELALSNRDVQFQEAIENTKKEAERIAIQTIKDEVDSVKKDMFTMFGIFASIVAFIVGEINILKTIDSVYDKVGFSFLFVSFMLGFLFGVMFLADRELNVKKNLGMVIVFSLFFGVGTWFINSGENKKESMVFTKEATVSLVASSTKPFNDFLECVSVGAKNSYQCTQSLK